MDRRAMLRVTDELLWVLRREGIAMATLISLMFLFGKFSGR